MNMKKSTRPVNRKIDTAQVSGQTGTGIEQRLSPSGSSSMDGGPVLGGDKRKPVTPDEAALTAKNYRLAKELVCFYHHHHHHLVEIFVNSAIWLLWLMSILYIERAPCATSG
jgi:hypothetical protein